MKRSTAIRQVTELAHEADRPRASASRAPTSAASATSDTGASSNPSSRTVKPSNRRLDSVVSSVVQVPLVWQTFSHYSDLDLSRSLAHHHELVAALRAADADWAESVMRSHVRAAWNSLRTEEGPTT